MMKEKKESPITYTNKLERIIQSLTRVEGCCKYLKQFVPIKNTKAIMKLMKFSIGSTIPKSPRYNDINYTTVNEDLSFIRLTSKLKDLLYDRYVYLEIMYVLEFY